MTAGLVSLITLPVTAAAPMTENEKTRPEGGEEITEELTQHFAKHELVP